MPYFIVTHANKCLFVVRVTYYLQIVLVFGLLTKTLAIKLPFVLQRGRDSKFTQENQENLKCNTEIQMKDTPIQTPKPTPINGKN